MTGRYKIIYYTKGTNYDSPASIAEHRREKVRECKKTWKYGSPLLGKEDQAVVSAAFKAVLEQDGDWCFSGWI